MPQIPHPVHEVNFRLAEERRRTENLRMDKFLVPVDFSDASGQLLAAAEEAARARGAALHLLHVVEPMPEAAGLGTDPAMVQMQTAVDLDGEKRVEADRMRQLSEGVKARGIPCTFEVRFGLPADEILEAAGSTGAPLVVMGSHGHGALYHLFTGSVVTGVLRRIDCPVLVVPLRQKKS